MIPLKYLSIGTLKTFNFPFVSNGKLIVFGVPIVKPIIIRLLCGQILGHRKIIFHLEQMENLLYLGGPILKHTTVFNIKKNDINLRIFLFLQKKKQINFLVLYFIVEHKQKRDSKGFLLSFTLLSEVEVKISKLR